METPKVYKENLKKGILTKDMLVDCLYSVNKRAKNARDKVRSLTNMVYNNRFFVDKYDSVAKYVEKKEEYYDMKEILLALFEPTCIHMEKRINKIYDYEEGRAYYLFYDLGRHSFHTPINKPDEYSRLKIVEVEQINTSGQNIEILLSVQFVRKVLELVKSGKYTFLDNN